MMAEPGKTVTRRLARGWIVAALVAVSIAGCVQLREIFVPTAPSVSSEWDSLLQEIRAFERRIGFRDTDNFVNLSEELEAYLFCGHVSRLYLPYSYEDPAIRWTDSMTAEECRRDGDGYDAYFGAVEALGEIGTPVTPAMVTGKLDRFLYLVIHEDCHDQFDLPYGIEEALCNLITYKAMEAFTREKFGAYAREDRAIRRYSETQSRLTRATVAYYDEIARLYARHERAEISSDALLKERAAIFRKAERALAWKPGDLNNVGIANEMTYSRHYPYLETVFEALGRDLARMVSFFRHVDRIKPAREAVMKRHRIASEKSVDFIRAYEAAVMETVARALSESKQAGSAQK